jgi:hypothetical protein
MLSGNIVGRFLVCHEDISYKACGEKIQRQNFIDYTSLGIKDPVHIVLCYMLVGERHAQLRLNQFDEPRLGVVDAAANSDVE